MRVTPPQAASTPPLRAPAAAVAVAVRSVAPVQAILPAEDTSGSRASFIAARREVPTPDYRPLLQAALAARRGGSMVEEGEGSEEKTAPPDGTAPAAGPASPPAMRSQAAWRWNSRYDGETLAGLYARMSGELVTLGTRVDAFA